MQRFGTKCFHSPSWTNAALMELRQSDAKSSKYLLDPDSISKWFIDRVTQSLMGALSLQRSSQVIRFRGQMLPRIIQLYKQYSWWMDGWAGRLRASSCQLKALATGHSFSVIPPCTVVNVYVKASHGRDSQCEKRDGGSKSIRTLNRTGQK